MSLRYYSEAEFERELMEKWKLQPTNEGTATSQMWKTPGGKNILVPITMNGDRIPDYMMDRVVRILSAIGENPFLKHTSPPPTPNPPVKR